MANNRLWLVHVPTQRGFLLAKRMGWGWYAQFEGDMAERINAFLDAALEGCDEYEEQDAFALVMEQGKAIAIKDWQYASDDNDGKGMQLTLTLE